MNKAQATKLATGNIKKSDVGQSKGLHDKIGGGLKTDKEFAHTVYETQKAENGGVVEKVELGDIAEKAEHEEVIKKPESIKTDGSKWVKRAEKIGGGIKGAKTIARTIYEAQKTVRRIGEKPAPIEIYAPSEECSDKCFTMTALLKEKGYIEERIESVFCCPIGRWDSKSMMCTDRPKLHYIIRKYM